MKKLFISFLLCFAVLIIPRSGSAQPDNIRSATNAFTFNLGQYLVNEINLGYEHFFSEKHSVELSGGYIYLNSILLKQAKSWTNSQYFYERGFSVRLHYKVYRDAAIGKGRKNYLSFGFNYQYLYFPNEWFDGGTTSTTKYVKNPSPASDSTRYTGESALEIYQHRFRNRIGADFTLGNILPMGKTFALEIFYGIGVRGILSHRFDESVREVFSGTSASGKYYASDRTYVSGNDDNKFYVRPTIQAGVKLRIGW